MALALPVTITREELARVAAANLLVRPEYSYYLLRSHTRRDPSVFLGYTYFGTITDGIPKVVSRRPVAWKGVKGIDAVRAVNPGVAEGLTRAIEISRGARGQRGVFGMRVGPNLFVVIPYKAVHQATLSPDPTKRAVGEAVTRRGIRGVNIVDVLTRLGTAPIMVRPRTALGLPRVRRARAAPPAPPARV